MTVSLVEMTFDCRDEYGRQDIGEGIVKLLREGPKDLSPIVIDGGWGIGKTEFCYKLINLLSSSSEGEFGCRYVDAFKADHADDPLATLLASVSSLIKSDTDRKVFFQKAAPYLKFGLKAIGKAGVTWVTQQGFEDFSAAAVAETAGKSIAHAVDSIVDDHEKAEQNLKLLRDALAGVTRERPLVVVVDELDRCRPDFAISMLEQIKHVFDVEKLTFVLVANMDQLRAAVTHRYGLEDANTYLDKFVKFRVALPELSSSGGGRYLPNAVSHFEMLVASDDKLSGLVEDSLKWIVEHLIRHTRLSLRQVESLVRNLSIYATLCDKAFAREEIIGYRIIRLIALFLYTFREQQAAVILRGEEPPPEDLFRALSLDGKELETEPDNDIIKAIRCWIENNSDSAREEDHQVVKSLSGWFDGGRAPDFAAALRGSLRTMIMQP